MPLTDELIKTLPTIYGLKPIYRLRWRLVFKDHKLDAYGGWNSQRQVPNEMAAFKDKSNLLYGIIEGERQGYGPKVLLEIDGHMVAGFQWVTAMSSPSFGRFQSYTNSGPVLGMSILTNSQKASVFIDGSGACRNLNEYELKHKTTEHSLGV